MRTKPDPNWGSAFYFLQTKGVVLNPLRKIRYGIRKISCRKLVFPKNSYFICSINV
jgi:hypothetical protein